MTTQYSINLDCKYQPLELIDIHQLKFAESVLFHINIAQ